MEAMENLNKRTVVSGVDGECGGGGGGDERFLHGIGDETERVTRG